LSNGSVYCWGFNGFGELGNDSLVNSSTPVLLTGSLGAQAIMTGAHHTCILSGGAIQCTGNNTYGQLGIGTTTNLNILGTALGF